jgi:hypothetical protein
MTIYELREQLQQNLITYLDELPSDLVDGVCKVVVDTFNDAFYAASENTK